MTKLWGGLWRDSETDWSKLQEIVDDFALASREEKVEMLIQYAESLPPLPERLEGERDKMDAVPECMTPVFLFAEKEKEDLIVIGSRGRGANAKFHLGSVADNVVRHSPSCVYVVREPSWV